MNLVKADADISFTFNNPTNAPEFCLQLYFSKSSYKLPLPTTLILLEKK